MIIFSNLKNFLKNQVLRRLTTKVSLFLLTGLCVVSLLFQYFSWEGSVPLTTVIGAVIVPFQEGINEIGGVLFRKEQERLSLRDAKKKIEELEEENLLLREKLNRLDNVAVENRELRDLLQAREALPDYEMVEAEIIGCDGVNCFRRFTIDRGSLSGIRVDMNVINEKGLVGIVTDVGLNYAIVTSIIEDGMNVSAMTKNGRENCIVKGDLSESGVGTLLLQNALSDVDFTEDGTLVTGNISDRFLPGILIGYAENVTVNAGGLTQSGTVRTAVDFTRLSEVMVITTLREKQKETEEAK